MAASELNYRTHRQKYDRFSCFVLVFLCCGGFCHAANTKTEEHDTNFKYMQYKNKIPGTTPSTRMQLVAFSQPVYSLQ
jgi:hypothetical protein